MSSAILPNCGIYANQGLASPTFGKVCLPVEEDYDNLEPLMKACSPATFGFKDKDVYDETYRKAVKLDESNCSTNCSPSNFGIIKTIEEMLLPSLEWCQRHSIKAELYKLNVSRPRNPSLLHGC